METNELLQALDETSRRLYEAVSALDQQKVNIVPFAGSWTVAQLAMHVTMSNNAIAQAMEMPGKPAGRDAAAGAEEIKKLFLNFGHKMKSPDFISPAPGVYDKDKMAAALKRSNELLNEKRGQADITNVINFPGFGEVTKLELLYFVLYHTQRHIYQLTEMLQHL